LTRRRVSRSALFLEHAEAFFPPAGSARGEPTFALFENGPLRGVEEQLARSFDELPEAAPGIRFAMTIAVPAFPPMVFYAALGTDGAVELLDVIIDEDYWDLVGDDPEG
jgi:hypothetical protein